MLVCPGFGGVRRPLLPGGSFRIRPVRPRGIGQGSPVPEATSTGSAASKPPPDTPMRTAGPRVGGPGSGSSVAGSPWITPAVLLERVLGLTG